MISDAPFYDVDELFNPISPCYYCTRAARPVYLRVKLQQQM